MKLSDSSSTPWSTLEGIHSRQWLHEAPPQLHFLHAIVRSHVRVVRCVELIWVLSLLTVVDFHQEATGIYFVVFWLANQVILDLDHLSISQVLASCGMFHLLWVPLSSRSVSSQRDDRSPILESVRMFTHLRSQIDSTLILSALVSSFCLKSGLWRTSIFQTFGPWSVATRWARISCFFLQLYCYFVHLLLMRLLLDLTRFSSSSSNHFHPSRDQPLPLTLIRFWIVSKF